MSDTTFRVPTTDPYNYPFAIVSKRRDAPESGGFELHFLAEGAKTAWEAHVQALRDSGEFDWVTLTTANYWEEEAGKAMGGGSASPDRPPTNLHRYSRR